MREYRSIVWTDDTARLAGFSSSTKGAASVIKIELKVTDTDRLGFIMSELAEIKRSQGTITVDAEEVSPRSRRRSIAADAALPLQLTHRKS